VILREIRELRKFFEVRTVSVRAPDRPLEQLSEEERDEEARTFYVKPQGAAGALRAALATLFSHPAAFFRGLFYALRLGGPKYAGYFAEALIVGDWMRAHNLKHLHVHYSSTVGLLVAKTFPIELSISFHGPDEFNDPAGFHLGPKIEACVFVRAISHYARSQLMKCCGFEHWAKIQAVYMGVDPDVFSPRPFREDAAPLEILCVGRLAPVKAQHILIAAVGELARGGRNALLHIVGGGPDRASLERDIEARGLSRHVILHGFAPQHKLDEMYRGADVFALASFAEGLPGVLMEAMAMEIPCVSTWITGVPELIRDGVDGLLVPPAGEQALAEALARLMDDAALRRRIGTAARLRILDKFDLRKNAAQLAAIFLEPSRGGTAR
jgi:colanic acid/amylovoran biosynthesis glycosyltransferase